MTNTLFADIILPLAVKGRFTYRIPEEMLDKVKPGIRVTVQFGNRNLYSGIVFNIHDKPPGFEKVKSIINIPDTIPLINEQQLKLWHWISDYYLCSEGEVMKAALPSETSLSGYRPRLETFIELSKKFSENELNVLLDILKKLLSSRKCFHPISDLQVMLQAQKFSPSPDHCCYPDQIPPLELMPLL